MDQAIAEYRNKKFGQNGELFQKQNDIMKPSRTNLQSARGYCKEDGYDYIFDRSGEILLLYANEKQDLTTLVIQRMQSFGK